MAVEARFCSGNYGVPPQDVMSTGADAGLNSLCFDRLQQQQSLGCFQLQNVNTHESCRSGLPQIISDNHRREIDQYIISQCEGLRLSLQEQRKRDLATILGRVEANSRYVLTQKDEELAKARSRAAQLELILQRAETEQQQWRKTALDREAHAIHLNNTLQQMLQARNNTDGDAESCCDVGRAETGLCRGCGCREACVVLLPCRHLCSCVACESVLDSCPVCRCLKQGAIQVLIL